VARPEVCVKAGVEESTALRELGRNILVFLSGVIATFVIGRILFEADKPNLALALLLLVLLCITFLGVGYFSTRLPMLQSGVAYFIGSFLDTTLNYAPAIYPDTHRFPLPALLKVMRGQLLYVAIACLLGYLGAWPRRRLKRRLGKNQ
jgi:hypothetical protein